MRISHPRRIHFAYLRKVIEPFKTICTMCMGNLYNFTNHFLDIFRYILDILLLNSILCMDHIDEFDKSF